VDIGAGTAIAGFGVLLAYRTLNDD
jgi:hypothetical protein